MSHSFLLSVLVLIQVVHYGSAIFCYECNSVNNYQCAESARYLPDALRKNCTALDRGGIKHTLCRKITQHVDVRVNGQLVPSRVIRTCGWDETKYKGSCYHRSGFGSRHEVCSCTSDYCNGSSTFTASTIIISLVASLKIVSRFLGNASLNGIE